MPMSIRIAPAVVAIGNQRPQARARGAGLGAPVALFGRGIHRGWLAAGGHVRGGEAVDVPGGLRF
jgi:hypothetical protein